jgi:hypothetical protein
MFLPELFTLNADVVVINDLDCIGFDKEDWGRELSTRGFLARVCRKSGLNL